MKSIYVVPSWNCNLRCPHCFVHKYKDNYNKDKFLSQLRELKSLYKGEFILHGGEPTLHKDRYYDIMATNIITSICSNLITDNSIIEDINFRKIKTSTSWNPNRFNSYTLNMWLNNIKSLYNKPTILITLDQDLLDCNLADFVILLFKLEDVGVKDILFEPLYDNSLDDNFQNKIDDWLCNIYHIWREYNIKLNNIIEDQIRHWNFRCDSLTLLPDGTVRKGCILGDECNKVLPQCLNCKLSIVCQPCVLHSRCSFYPKFYRLVTDA